MSGIPHLIHTDSSTSGSSSSALTTPRSEPQSLSELFLRAGYSPLKRGADIPIADFNLRGRDLLEYSGIDVDAVQRDDKQRVKLAFLIARNQDQLLQKHFQNDRVSVIRLMQEAFGEAPRANLLYSYVKSGGDEVVVESTAEYNNDTDPLERILARHSEFRNDETGPTIFNHPEEFYRVKKPIKWTQEDFTTICWLVCGALCIFYKQSMQNGTTQDDIPFAFASYAVNINRYMRELFTDQEVFENLFLGHGGYPSDMVDKLLLPMNPTYRTVTFRIPMFDYIRTPDEVFNNVKSYLRDYGAIMIDGFQIFPQFREVDTVVFEGDWRAGLPPDYPDEKHALLVVGVHRTTDDRMGGVSFLLQNSWAEKPFVVVGLDLLRSMNIVAGTVISENLVFQTFGDGQEAVVPAHVRSGSPRHAKVEFVEQALEFGPGKEPEYVHAQNSHAPDPSIWEPLDPNKQYSKTTFG